MSTETIILVIFAAIAQCIHAQMRCQLRCTAFVPAYSCRAPHPAFSLQSSGLCFTKKRPVRLAERHNEGQNHK